jgi:predicted RNase H-like HicB family nuclease
MIVRYPIAIEIGTGEAAYGVVVPDLPGCFSAGDTLDEAVTGAEEPAAAWIDATLDAGGAVPAASSMAAIQADPAYAGWVFDVILVDPTRDYCIR